MNDKLEKLAYQWGTVETAGLTEITDYYCQTRDVFQARLDKMLHEFLRSSKIAEEDAYILSAIVGEIGNNSFDHNLGNWPNVPGIFFGYSWEEQKLIVALVDRGKGVFATLAKVKPEIRDDEDALRVAFTEKISGRAPENRGNGLKFVKENVGLKNYHLTFISGKAKALLNEKMELHESDQPVNGTLAVIKKDL